MNQPCRDQNIKISLTKGAVSVVFNGKTIASTSNALDLAEASYHPVIYVPLADVNSDFLQASTHTTHCPYKGDASYYSLVDGDKISKNAVWYYPVPCPLVEQIKDHVAFWGDDIEYVLED
jgi:uncharacterized protein (DUF427 family)